MSSTVPVHTAKSTFRLPFVAWASVVLAACSLGRALASPDTDVANKLNFSTDVVYQIVTDRFIDGNSANNPTGAAFSSGCVQLKLYCGGDWKGIQNAIENGYLAGMGITAIWISPPVEDITTIINYSGVDNAAYHGYWARDFKHTNPAFGTFTDFSNLIASAHAHHIKVIIDFAPNHTSPASQTDATFAENGIFKDNGTTLSTYSPDPGNFFHHYGGTDFSTLENGIYKNLFDLADLDHNNSTVDTYFKNAIKLWLDLGIDAVRFDAVKHMPFGWQKNLMAYILGYKPVFSFGEWFLSPGEVDPANQYHANNSGMSLLDFEFAQTVRQVFRDGTASMTSLDSMISSTATQYNQVNDQVTFIDNHDMPRFQSSGASNRPLEQALAFTLTSRGVPAIYYGTEQYMTGTGDPTNRAKMSSFNTSTTAYAVIHALALLRKSNPALAYGTTQQRWLNSNIYIYERQFGSNVAVIAINRDLSNPASIGGLFTALPAGTYTDALIGLLNGNTISVGSGGAVPTFTLGAGAVSVWQFTTAATAPKVAHVGPMVSRAGSTVTIDGRGFGTTKGTVFLGATAVTGTSITQWEDTEIKAVIPSVTPGTYGVSIRTAGSLTSNTYNLFQVLTGPQVAVRFVVNNAFTSTGENINLAGDNFELTNWNATAPFGPLFNQIVDAYPSWYADVSVPASSVINFKFIRKGPGGTVWEGGNNHVFTSPAAGTATVSVNWQN
jgi:glycosidase